MVIWRLGLLAEGKVLHCVQDDGMESMRMRNKAGTIKVKVKVKTNGGWCRVSAPKFLITNS